MWRYRGALAYTADPVSIQEGCTPLLPYRTKGGIDVLVKAEYRNPTGSFKDRGSSVLVSAVLALGEQTVLEDSSGNGGSSISCYCAAAGIRAKILVPESTSPAKITMSRLLGAEIERVPGPRQATSEEAIRQSSDFFYASHSWHPAFLEGTKTLAYELWEDLGFTAPDNVVIPTGGGSLVLGCAMGFDELKRSGLITRVPRLLMAQPANCSPLVRALHEGKDGVDPEWEWQQTAAEGTAIASPVRDQEVLAAVRTCNGSGVAISENEILASTRDLAAAGFYVEPTSATAVAAADRFSASRVIASGQTTVVVLTGSGLKAAHAMADLADLSF